ncbi:glycosyltransferase [Oxalobacteraceae bacterium OM1]|nr:glycosyltransferase [Oxalobacteraceae bacterium OM1]
MSTAHLLSRDGLPEAVATQRHVETHARGQSSRARRILVLSVSAGAGHVRAAQAIEAHAARRTDVDILHLDALDYMASGFRRVYSDYYLQLVARYPALWGQLYKATDRAEPDAWPQRLRRGIERTSARALLRALDVTDPDLILCTHFLPAELLGYLAARRPLRSPVWVQVTDFDLHRMWVQPNVAGYFVASEEVAHRMRARGVPAERIHLTGIPVMPAFRQLPERRACALELSLDPQRPTVLLMGGGAGLGGLPAVAAQLLGCDARVQLAVLAGRNPAVLAAMKALAAAHPGRVAALPFTDRVERVMACADLVVTKPGGLTVSECLAFGLPMVLHSPIPGQEERNADYLLEQGVAVKAGDAVTLEYLVRQLLSDAERRAAMAARARALGRPDAAGKVIEILLAG